MKLETTVPLRRDGTVIVTGLDKQRYVFKPEPESGLVVCDIAHEPTVAHLLNFGNFFPADEADHEAANRLLDGLVPTDDQDEDLDDEDDDDDEANHNALPIEAGTPPASMLPAAKAPRGKAAAKAK